MLILVCLKRGRVDNVEMGSFKSYHVACGRRSHCQVIFLAVGVIYACLALLSLSVTQN